MSVDSLSSSPLLVNPEARSNNNTTTTFAKVKAQKVDGRSQGAGNDIRNTKSKTYYEPQNKSQAGSITQNTGNHYHTHTHNHYHGQSECAGEQSHTRSRAQSEAVPDSIEPFISQQESPLAAPSSPSISSTTPEPTRQLNFVSDFSSNETLEVYSIESYKREVQGLQTKLQNLQVSNRKDIQLHKCDLELQAEKHTNCMRLLENKLEKLSEKLVEQAERHRQKLQAQNYIHRNIAQVLQKKLQQERIQLSESKQKHSECESEYQGQLKEAQNNLCRELETVKCLKFTLGKHKAETKLARETIIELGEKVKRTQSSKEDLEVYYNGQIASLNDLVLKSSQQAHKFKRERIVANIDLKSLICGGLQAKINTTSALEASQNQQLVLAEDNKNQIQRRRNTRLPREEKMRLRDDLENAKLEVAAEDKKLEEIRVQLLSLRKQEKEVSAELGNLYDELEKIDSEDTMADSQRTSSNSLSTAPDLIPDEDNAIEPEYSSIAGTLSHINGPFYNASHNFIASKLQRKHNRASSYLPRSSMLWI